MRAVSLYATAVVTAAMLAPWMGAYAQDSKLSVPNVTVTAQGPAATTVFDGKYVGTATLEAGKDPADCLTTSSMDMTIAGGQVLIHADGAMPFNNGLTAKLTFQGSVNAAGEISASASTPAGLRTLTGTIRDKVFSGRRLAAKICHYTIQMVKQ